MIENRKGFSVIIIILVFILVGTAGIYFYKYTSKNKAHTNQVSMTTTATQTPTPLFPYKAPKIEKNQSYRIMLVGDSMTRALGVNANPLRLELINRYPDSEFVTYNYSIPSSNILTLPDRLNSPTTFEGETYEPILRQGFDLIIIESFGHNPLSELSLEEGLERQNQVLTEAIEKLTSQKPEVVIALLATIAPSENYAEASRDLNDETREKWIAERKAYIENHIGFAKKNNIPLINVYEKSTNEEGFGKEIYINEDTVHPSSQGVGLIAETIAEEIFSQELFPR